jgi:SIT4-associating protein SAP185/190
MYVGSANPIDQANAPQWLQQQNLVPQLLAYLSPEHSSSTQTSAGDFLKAIITISANATTQDQSVIGPNELTRQLVSEQCINELISDMLKGGNPLTVGVGIIIEVIRKNNSDYDLENQIGPVPKNTDPIYLGTLLRQFATHIPQFMELVHNSNHIVTNKDGTVATRKRELKTAFGEKIEPLGFDRFKTCELMAELLHCSNMALLNERGSESEVKRRDTERERLKAEGKLTSRTSATAGDFSTSVDSHGFHHARAPSSEAPEELKKLEVQNNSEDDFEKVTASEATSEKEPIGEPLEQSPKSPTKRLSEKSSEGDGEFVDEPLSPAKETAAPTAASPAKVADDAESPTSAGLSAKVGGLDLDNDTVMEGNDDSTAAKAESDSKERPSLLTQQLNKGEGIESPEGISPHPDDKPAPLFSGRSHNRTNSSEQSKPDSTRFTSGVAESEGSEVTPIDESSSARSVLFGGVEGQYAPQYEVDIDGSPVVGDLLKIKFVENKVVPTILVSLCLHILQRMTEK